jgi:hypothetical protein
LSCFIIFPPVKKFLSVTKPFGQSKLELANAFGKINVGGEATLASLLAFEAKPLYDRRSSKHLHITVLLLMILKHISHSQYLAGNS